MASVHPPAPGSGLIGIDELTRMLSPSVGEKPAREAIVSACATLSLPATAWSRADALRILELLSGMPGLLGISARFVKSRAILIWDRR